ncbi:MAG: tetratricopeptide repeat protein, partial [Verrucomicrobia bacterium]|nr:tetratricopeptide repeat protein [Verrucomicrobiota bacterium]
MILTTPENTMKTATSPTVSAIGTRLVPCDLITPPVHLAGHNHPFKRIELEVRPITCTTILRKILPIAAILFCLCSSQVFAEDVPSSEQIANWRKAADKGNAEALFSLGVCYDQGAGVKQDKAEAAMWYRKAAELGHVIAQNNLGFCYANGQGVPKNEVEAVKWFHKSAEQGNAMSQYKLGTIYAFGEGVPKDEVEGAKSY